MLEISKNDDEKFRLLKEKRKVYPGAVYDFTFENRFIICHAPVLKMIIYYAVDTKTGYSSEVIRITEKEITEQNYKDLISPILYSIKYTGDCRYFNIFAFDTENLIDTIFRTILPAYGYAEREEQIRLSKKVFRGLTEKQVSICEAEVGTGKTMAYLVAAVCARKSLLRTNNVAVPVTISTSSIELQKEIIEKEIPQLSKMLMDYQLIKSPLTSVLRKGKEHYFCPSRYYNYMKSIKKYPEKYKDTISYFEKNDFVNLAFDLDKVNIRSSTKDKICVKGSCSKCRYKGNCAYYDFVTKVSNSRCSYDFQVTNHNLFLMANKELSTLRESCFVIIDEAHKLQEAAMDIYGERIAENIIAKYVAMIKTSCKDKTDLPDYRTNMNIILKASEILFGNLKKRILGNASEFDFKSPVKLTEREKICIRAIISGIERLEELRKKTGGRYELNGTRIIKTMSKFLDSENVTVWLDENDDNTVSLCCAENNIGRKLLGDVWKKKRGHVLLSGTMSDGTDFAFFKKENGLDKLRKDLMLEYSSPSPFNYAENTRLYMPTDLPKPSNEYAQEYISAISDRIVSVINATHGHCAVLFTSYKALSLVYGNIRDKLSDYEVFCMSRANKNAISDFKKSNNGVLFAAGSMWEGVDCRGDVLSSVIIVRLPFPLRTASMEIKKKDYEDMHRFLNEYAVPNMLIKLRQGMGRLIRSETDTGLITILDTRASNRLYKPFIDSVTHRYPRIDTINDISEFFNSVKDKSYFNH